MSVVDPDPERLPDILSGIPADTPVVMLNLLRFRTVAQYRDGEADYDGREAYRRYSEVATKHRTAALEEARLIATRATHG